ncbi:TolC family protein [Paraburkholderia sp. JPY465]|uniref:TolC family protein n=1 Tax=Paraburkholderia sp. JPY465 TaxID=3042285 RepID=UPI003D1EDBCC
MVVRLLRFYAALLVVLPVWTPAGAGTLPNGFNAPPEASSGVIAGGQSLILRLGIHEALERALMHTAVIRTAELELQQQEAQSRQARHEFLPQPTFSGGLERDRASAIDSDTVFGNGNYATLGSTWKLRSGTQLAVSESRQSFPATGLGSAGNSNVNGRVMSLSITQPLLRGSDSNVILLNEHQADLALDMVRESMLQTQRNVVFLCLQAYFGLEQAMQNVSLAQAALTRAAESRSINEALLAAGRIAAIALLQSDADLAQAQLGLMQSEQAELVARRQLMRVIGRDEVDPDRTNVTLTDSFTSYLPQEAPNEDKAVQDALAKRADLAIAVGTVKANEFDVVAANDGTRNQLDLYARLDRATESFTGSRSRQVNVSVGLTYTIPLEKSESRLTLSAARTGLRKAEIERADLERVARAEVSDAVRNINSAVLQYQMAQRTAQLAQRRLDSEVEKTRAGRSSATDLSLAQDALNQAQFQAYQARFAIFVAELELQRVSGNILEQWHMQAIFQDASLAS